MSPGRLDVVAVAVGLGIGLAVALPVLLVARVVAGSDPEGGWDVAIALTTLGAAGVAGAVTGRNEPANPLFNGAMAAGALYVVLRLVSWIASGELPAAPGMVLALLLFLSVGTIGASLASIRRPNPKEDTDR